MKKRLITIILALVLIVTMAAPAMANSPSEISSRLRQLARERPQAAPHLNSAANWVDANPDRVRDDARAILGHINSAASYGARPVDEFTLAQVQSMVHHIREGVALAGLTATINMQNISNAIAAGNLTPGILLANITVEGITPTAAEGALRQTGFTADYSILLIVASVLAALFAGAMVTSVRLRVRHDVAK